MAIKRLDFLFSGFLGLSLCLVSLPLPVPAQEDIPTAPPVRPTVRSADPRPRVRGGEVFFKDLVVEATTGPTFPDGKRPQCDLPTARRLHNKGGSDGSGLCVFTSCNHAALWQNIRVLQDFRDWMTRYPGGGYPTKLDSMIARKCKEAGVPVPDYIQIEQYDPEILKLALKTGRMPCITYNHSPSGRYNGQRIAHMINCVGYNGQLWMVLDNNYPEMYELLNDSEFRSVDPSWVVIFLGNPPSPPRLK